MNEHSTTPRESDPQTRASGRDATAGSGKGRLFVISAPSGAGKTSLCAAVRRRFPEMAYSVSYTTRAPRKGEQNGRDYHFISPDEFRKGISDGRWAEWAEVHGNYYGTSAHWIETALTHGRSVLMDIDVQGARQIVARFADAVTIFIMPPTWEELERRLRQRATENEKTLRLRLANARLEIEQKDFYQYIVVNDDLEIASRELIDLIGNILTQAPEPS